MWVWWRCFQPVSREPTVGFVFVFFGGHRGMAE
jgi:hypothetical protein